MLPDFRIGPTIIIRSYALMLDVAIIVGLLLLGVFGALEDDERPAAWVDAGLGALVATGARRDSLALFRRTS
jgi:hypothetical protein